MAGAAVGARRPSVPRPRQFIQDYNSIAAPLTSLLWKEVFKRCPVAEKAFHTLQRALMTASVLQLLTFDREFIVECDASGSNFGVVLHQGDDLLELFSKQVTPRHAKLTAYDHFCLKYLLDHRFSMIPQHQWASKLLSFDFRVEYNPNILNEVVDAL
jgi:hypothetical protein